MLAAGIFQGAMYGGSITSVLLGIPGTPTNTATCFDGFSMSKKGQSREALGASLTASAIGGFFFLYRPDVPHPFDVEDYPLFWRSRNSS